jgi:hypothetical protein
MLGELRDVMIATRQHAEQEVANTFGLSDVDNPSKGPVVSTTPFQKTWPPAASIDLGGAARSVLRALA